MPRTRRVAPTAQLVAQRVDPQATIHVARVRARRGWTDGGIKLSAGEHVTVLATGTLWTARPLGLGLLPKVGLWLRIGTGPALSMLGSAITFACDQDGPLKLLAAEPGALDASGALDDNTKSIALTGSYEVVVIRWATDPHLALTRAAALSPDLFGPAHLRHRRGDTTPVGWNHHPRIGASEIFSQPSPGGEVECLTSGDVGIVRRPVDVPLTEDLTLDWTWLVRDLPSALAENIEPTHDYLSVAVEFDDGRDLSWIWSSELPEGKVFSCPLPYWSSRETHLVIRSGTTGLGAWQPESRHVLADAASALATPLPSRVVAIWLIANSACQGSVGSFTLRDLRLRSTHLEHDVLAALAPNPSRHIKGSAHQ
ncbi:DUF3047 domain-containing protein [Aeromicrobium sp. A1-2]|uniref:DUF3047 domain-containing protein n=1 Tax=Aeromicrobium sp. A1-2 TaxID=2107713 RepID=UPI0013C36BA0|nr:DUF3047 domain-containing protein [Aeromicrobium sp. A1-2]